ncbi:YopX family protein, partial [Clostridium tertium]|uniref:YopX family protein n=1 Tax=Clostridium tertium TaxID=1559 RepID=UPI001FAE6B49
AWNAEIMQYTGLKDKNGKEIYEGDIVKYKVKGSDKTYTTVMKFNEDHGAFLFGIYEGVKMPCGKKTRMNKYTRKSVGSVEVIGNIYENPGLLEGN